MYTSQLQPCKKHISVKNVWSWGQDYSVAFWNLYKPAEQFFFKNSDFKLNLFYIPSNKTVYKANLELSKYDLPPPPCIVFITIFISTWSPFLKCSSRELCICKLNISQICNCKVSNFHVFHKPFVQLLFNWTSSELVRWTLFRCSVKWQKQFFPSLITLKKTRSQAPTRF